MLNLFHDEQKAKKTAELKQEFLGIFENIDTIPSGVNVSLQGESTLNKGLNLFLIQMSKYKIRPIICTAIPDISKKEDNDIYNRASLFINDYVNTFNECYNGIDAVLKLDLSSTSEKERKKLHGSVKSLESTAKMLLNGKFPTLKNDGKIVLSFRADSTVDFDKISKLFPNDMFLIEIRQPDEVLLNFNDLDSEALAAGYEIFHD